MSTVVFRQAKILVNGAELSANFSDGPDVEYAAEMLDETSHGDTTRTNRGGLLTGRISGSGNAEFGAGALEDILFAHVGVDGASIVVFPNGITEGSQTLCGYAMLGTVKDFKVGAAVGALLPFSFEAEGRGVIP